MEQYKEKLKMQNRIIVIGIVILMSFFTLALLGEFGILPAFSPTAGDTHWQSMWRGFLSGATFGLTALLLVGLIRNLRAMKDDRKLKQLYVKEHDERSIKIWNSARSAAMQTFLILGMVAGIAAGYFSTTVCITIICCITVNSLIGMFFAFYFSKKY